MSNDLRGHEQVISIRIEGDQGRFSLPKLEALLGPCSHDTLDGPAWAAQQLEGHGEARCFAAPSESLPSVPPSGVTLADGVTVKLERVNSANCRMLGSGANYLLACRAVPGMRQTASVFPDLPKSWAAAIDGALHSGGRLLKPGVGQPRAPAVPSTVAATASKPQHVVVTPTSRPPVSHGHALPRGAAETQRRSRIVAKYGIATAEQRAKVNAAIADGSAP